MKAKGITQRGGLLVTLHVAGVLLYTLSPLFFNAMRSPRFENIQISFIFHNALIATFFYFNMLVLIPKVQKDRGWIAYVIVGLICVVAFSALSHYARDFFFPREFRRFSFDRVRTPPNRILQYVGYSLPFLMAWIFSTSVKFSMDYFRMERRRKETENEGLRSELGLLRSQISPHFMFNVLNSLTALARKKSDELEPFIIKLSQLMRYSIYHTDPSGGGRVPLDTELEYLENYVDLQKLRFGHHVSVKIEKDIRQPDYQIEPMLLISFVENAFKHGVVLVPEPVINISLQCADGVLKFAIKNKFVPTSTNDETHGVGLRNVKRRLELLYEDRFELTITQEEPWFTIHLNLIEK